MFYRKRYINENDYLIEELRDSDRLREISEQQPDYQNWLALGNVPEMIPYVPPPPPPEPTLEEAQAQKRNELKWTRDEIIGAGFLFGEWHFPLNTDIQSTMMMEFMGSQVMPASYYAWKDVDGIYREMGDAAAFQQFCLTAMGYGKSVYAREEMLQGLVNAAATVAEVEAISWETVPDEMP